MNAILVFATEYQIKIRLLQETWFSLYLPMFSLDTSFRFFKLITNKEENYKEYLGNDSMDWRYYIHSDPDILVGKPVVKGTRLAVDFILRLFAVGWTEQQILKNYPTLTPAALRAVFAFAADCLGEKFMYAMPAKVA